jgi:ribonuclease G
LPWFRRRQKDGAQSAAATAVAPAEEELGPPEPETAEADGEVADPAGAPKRKRRRGSRGGRGRKKPAGAATDGADGAEADADGAGGADGGEPAEEPRARASSRGTRGGRKEEKKDDRKDGKERERRSSRSAPRRRQQQRRAPLPAAKRELLISVDVGEQRVAVLEDDRVAEVYLERPERRSIAGNIYLGVVDNVLPGMEAAFVEIGLEKNGFLYVDEIVVPELEGRRHGKKIQDLISRGEQILVQAVKDPMKTKGARLTTEISLPGRFLVYVPNGEGLGVSRRLDDAERDRLKGILKELDFKGGGIIVRTAAEGASAEDIERDLVFLQRLWSTVQARAKGAKAPALVYQEAELPLRIVRDLFAGDFLSATIDHERTYKRIVGYLKKTSPHMIERVHRYKERTPLFEEHGVDREIESTLDRRVDLPSGGYLIFDYAEAFTVVDVNTGRFVGSRSKTSSQRLEDTITKNNLEAVKEVVRQLRLRDIGGIIVIDFIDMANPKNRAQVEEALRTELERDRTKTYVVEISPLGLVEMTRQNVTDGPREILTRKCPVCAGDGIVVSDQTVAMQIERRLRALAAAGTGTRVQAYKVAVHPRLIPLVAGPGGARLAAIEEAAKRRFFLVGADNGHLHSDHFEVLAEGKLADLQPETALEEGAEIELKLVEVGLHDPAAAVGKVNGIDVVVAGAAKLVGKKATVVVGRVLEGQAFATLAGEEPADGPITFESEAEKPTRAPARRKTAAVPAEAPAAGDEDELPAAAGAEAADGAEAPAGEAELDEGQIEDEPDEGDEDGGAEAVTDGAVPKKRTRRGSRGGRRRKKKPAETAAENGSEPAADGDEPEPVAETAPADGDEVEAAQAADAPPKQPRRRTPKVHLPAADLEPGADQADGAGETAPDGTATKPRTRRGSRGGRNRKRKTPETAAAGDGDGAEAPLPAVDGEQPVPGEAVPAAAAGEPGYVPMSEWLDDFDR